MFLLSYYNLIIVNPWLGWWQHFWRKERSFQWILRLCQTLNRTFLYKDEETVVKGEQDLGDVSRINLFTTNVHLKILGLWGTWPWQKVWCQSLRHLRISLQVWRYRIGSCWAHELSSENCEYQSSTAERNQGTSSSLSSMLSSHTSSISSPCF